MARCWWPGGYSGTSYVANAELYDPATNSWTTTGAGTMITARAGHTATLLGNGVLLVTGGTNSNGPLASTEIYIPTAGWMTMGGLSTACYDHTAVLLGNGKVLVAGGQGSGSVSLNNAQIFPPQGYIPLSLLLED